MRDYSASDIMSSYYFAYTIQILKQEQTNEERDKETTVEPSGSIKEDDSPRTI